MLNDLKARQAKPKDRPYKLADQGGLYLRISPSGVKSWRYDYRLGRRETITIGRYPEVSLSEARRRHLEARRKVEQGESPAKAKVSAKQADSFEAVAESWFSELAPHRSESWRQHIRHYLDDVLYPSIGKKAVRSVTPAELLSIMKRVSARGNALTADRLRQTASRVFIHAIRNLLADADPAHPLKGAIVVPRVQHRRALNAWDLPAFLDAVDGYQGNPGTRIAVHLLLLTMVRKSELLKATWDEVDIDGAEWRVPAARMKMRLAHVVPLCTQAAHLFSDLHRLACGSRYVLPGVGDPHKSMGENTISSMLHAIGYKGRLTAHGLRATASTVLNEQGFRPEVIDRQLAHAERSKVVAAYNRATYLAERRRMMQWWADYLDRLRAGGEIVPIRAV